MRILAVTDRQVELRMRVAREFADWLREELGEIVLDVRVFGSTARGEVHEDSDVDVFILVSRPLTLDEELALAGKMVDLLMETSLFVQWVDRTQERWETPVAQATGLARAIREQGVPV
jgi:predicted nucleotidyltransferase